MANSFKRAFQRNIGTSLTTVYTCPSATEAVVIGVTVANTTGATVYADVVVTISATDYYIVKTAPVPSGGSLVAVGVNAKLVLNASDIIKVKSDTATSLDAFASVLEIA